MDSNCANVPASDAADLIPRYSRQMVVPSIGMSGQDQLSRSSILVVGAGGIGSTVLLYLAGAGVGHIGVLDFDVVEVSNLHRQIIHDTRNKGMKKCLSAVKRMKALNDSIKYTALDLKLSAENAMESFAEFDVIVDATDNFQARYIINDACVLLGKPLVSGSAVGMEGQVTVIAPRISPCYRCMYPCPSLLEGCRSCANAGVLGPVPGLIGCLQASEAIKLLVDKDIIQNIKIEHKNHQILIIEKNEFLNENNTDEHKNKKIKFDNFTDDQSSELDNSINNSTKKVPKSKSIVPLIGRQILYDASYGEFHNFVLPAKNLRCEICSEFSTIFDMVDSKKSMLDYEDKVKKAAPDLSLPVGSSISVLEYADVCRNTSHIQLDVRSITQFEMLSFKWYENKNSDKRNDNLENDHSHSKITETNDVLKNGKNSAKIGSFVCRNVAVIHFPLSEIRKSDAVGVRNEIIKRIDKHGDDKNSELDENEESDEGHGKRISETVIYCICRRGVDSTLSTQLLRKMGFSNVINVSGGITAWSAAVDTVFPAY